VTLLNDLFAGTADVVKAVGQLLSGRTELVYQAGFLAYQPNFAHPSPDWFSAQDVLPVIEPTVDLFHLGHLQFTQSSSLDGHPLEPNVAMVPADWNQGILPGVRLQMQRPSDVDPKVAVGVGAVVYPFPSGLDLFKVTVGFQLAQPANDQANRFACVVAARKGGVPDTVMDPRTERISATLHWSYNATAGHYEAQVNTPAGAPLGTPFPIQMGKGGHPPVPTTVRNAVYSMQPGPSLFELELLINRGTNVARVRLTAFNYTSHPYVEEWWFVHELIPASAGDMSAVGFGLSIPGDGGNGPVAVTIRKFEIHNVRRGMMDVLTTLSVPRSVLAGLSNDGP